MKTIYIERNKLFKNIPMILCNNITQADENFIENNFELFYRDCEECKGTGGSEAEPCEECYGEGQHEIEAYQYFIVDVNEWDIKRLEEYDIKLGYSELLDLHIMPIYDFGTSWSAFSYSKEVEDNYELYPDETETRTTVY